MATKTKEPRRSLYELSDDLLAWESLMEEAEGEMTPELEALETEVFGNIETKIDSIGGFFKHLEIEEKAILNRAAQVADEVKRLKVRAAGRAKIRERLLALIDVTLTRTDRKEFAGEFFTAKRRGKGGVQPLEMLVPPDDLPQQFVTINTTVSANKAKIREALEKGDADAVKIAVLMDRGYTVVIK